MMKFLSRDQYPILAVNAIVLVIFSILFLSRANYEFVLYLFVIIFFLVLILLTNKQVGLSNKVLWGLTAWGVLHLCGGGLLIGDHVLYAQMLVPISDGYQILKYDQFVHAFGFGVATFVIYELLKPLLKEGQKKWGRLGLIVVMGGAGLGALNEVIEFFATVITPETGVGGYVNTALDLVFNFVGASIAMFLIYRKEKKTVTV